MPGTTANRGMLLRHIVSKSSSLPGRARGLSISALRRKLRRAVSTTGFQPRRLVLESLESRALLTYTLPFGATPNDTGEYMLGDVAVNVVLMESDPSIYPNDNGTLTYKSSNGTLTSEHYTPENWTPAAIDLVKQNIQTGLQWWKDTLANMFPSAPADSLNFHINWQYADNPVHTGYEPIARFADDVLADSTIQKVAPTTVSSVVDATQFSGGASLSPVDGAYNGKTIRFLSGTLKGQHGTVLNYVGATHTFTFAPNTFSSPPSVNASFQIDQGWLYDFLDAVGYGNTGIYGTDIRAFNDSTRQAANADWAFTIFVVSNANDPDKMFRVGGSYLQAFSIPGGAFEVVPASRSATTFAHETGHQFWAMDEYNGGDSYTVHSGYYNTQNFNSENNPLFAYSNEVQSIAPYQGSVTGGTFKLTINLAGGDPFTTAPIAYDASSAVIRDAINTAANAAKVPQWLNNDIAVIGTPLNGDLGITLTFSGSSVSEENQPLVVIDGTNLTGGGTVGAITEEQAGGVPPATPQSPTIMGTDHKNRVPQTLAQQTSFENHVLDPYTMATIGWQDSDGDGIMDVLDVPFTLTGTGSYNSATGIYSFRGASHVNTLPNQNSNPLSTQDDITINQIRDIQYQVNNGSWVSTLPVPLERVYSTNVSVDVAIPPGSTVRFRTIDTTTGVASNYVTGTTETPTSDVLEGLAGTIFFDQNGDSKWDNSEPTKPGVMLSVTDQNDAPLALQHTIEPNNYAENAVLNSVDSAVTLKSVGENVSSINVVARTYAGIAAAGKVFTGTDLGVPKFTWNQGRQLQINFNSPVSTVSINAYGNSATTSSFARLDAYNSSDQLIARFNSGPLTNSAFTTMTVGRAAGDIAYVIAYGSSGTDAVLDTLTWGPPTTATSDSQGAFSLNYLPDGTYHIHFTPAAGFHVSNPATGVAVITVSSGITTNNMNFGVASDSTPTYKFHNYDNRYSVNPFEDNVITALDALIVINYINAHPSTTGTIPLSNDPNIIGYIDVVADGACAADDVLSIINYINANPQREATEDTTNLALPAANNSSLTANGASASLSGSQGESEFTVEIPKLAADSNAHTPAIWQSAGGADQPCSCAACRAARGDTVLVQPAEPLVAPPASASPDGSGSIDTALDLIAADVSRFRANDSA